LLLKQKLPTFAPNLNAYILSLSFTKKSIYFEREKTFMVFSLFLLFSKLPLQRQFTEQQKFTLKIY